MGVVQSSVTTEAAAVGALLAGTVTAYTVYKRVADVDQTGKDAGVSGNAGAAPSGKKSKGKKRKDANAAAGSGNKSERDIDDEIDELLARAKAETAAELAEARARAEASGGLIPGAFDQEATTVTAMSSEAEGREKKTRRKGKKAQAATPGPAASSGAVRDGDNKEVPASSKPIGTSANQPAPAQASPEPAGPSKKQKKRKGAKADAAAAAAGSAGGAASSSAKAADKPASTPSVQSSQAMGMSLTMSDAPEDASWTRVSTRKKAQQTEAAQTDPELLTSDTNLTTSGVTDPENTEEDEGSVQEPDNRRTFAERMLPRPRKTGVEDMEDEPLQPTLARVIRVKPAPGEKPAEGFSWGDYEEYARGDDGTSADGDADDVWEEVKSKKKSKLDRSASGMASSADSLPLVQRASSAQSAPTKRQRQNADRREAARLEKDTQEQERLDRLARHRRELERVRIAEQYSGSGSKKNVSGGMKASVAESGKLVWD